MQTLSTAHVRAWVVSGSELVVSPATVLVLVLEYEENFV